MTPEWNREALLANPALESLWPVLRLCPPDRFPTPEDLTRLASERGLQSGGGARLRFAGTSGAVPHTFEMQYEVRIYRGGEVSTRPDNFHDLFNALVWLVFPRTKALLNRRHYEHIVERGDGSRGTARKGGGSRGTARKGGGSRGTARKGDESRGTARDVLTLLDESGMIVACGEPGLAALLQGFRWKALFWSQRAAVLRGMRFLSFGHAIHEKALRPYKALTAKALIIAVPHDFLGLTLDAQLAEADALVARRLSAPDALAATNLLAPLPILGIPGWNPANECESYYDDASVFRPGRRLQQ